MSFNIVVNDICKLKCDVIVNSIGTDNTIFGRLCENIVKEANSKELESYLHSLTNSEINQIYITDSYNIPCEKIINIATPYRKLDDGNKLLKQAYKKVLQTAYDNGFKDICIPYIGTGANGYSDTEAYDAATTVCSDFCDKYDDVDIRLVLYSNKKSLRNVNDGHYREIDRRIVNLGRPEVNESSTVMDLVEFNNALRLRRSDEYYTPKWAYYDNPMEFIDEYLAENHISIKNVTGVLGKNPVSFYRTGARKMPKDVFLACSILCGFSFGTFKLYLSMFGYTLSPYINAERFYYEYYMGKYPHDLDFCHLNILFSDTYDEESLLKNLK